MSLMARSIAVNHCTVMSDIFSLFVVSTICRGFRPPVTHFDEIVTLVMKLGNEFELFRIERHFAH